MTSHLLPSWKWVECPEPDTCLRLIHVDEAAELLQSYPQEWVFPLADCKFRVTNSHVELLNDNGEVHNDFGHARELEDGSIQWYQHGYRYRVDGGPSMIHVNGSLSWTNTSGWPHREDGPAVIRANGITEWYLDDEYHRDGGPAVEYANGKKVWYQNGSLHREDGPAIEYPDGKKMWFQDGALHREDGPAVIHADGRKEWFLEGKKVSEDFTPLEEQ